MVFCVAWARNPTPENLGSERLPPMAAGRASSTSETTSENQRKSKIPHPATGGQTARIPRITRFSIPVHIDYERRLIAAHFDIVTARFWPPAARRGQHRRL